MQITSPFGLELEADQSFYLSKTPLLGRRNFLKQHLTGGAAGPTDSLKKVGEACPLPLRITDESGAPHQLDVRIERLKVVPALGIVNTQESVFGRDYSSRRHKNNQQSLEGALETTTRRRQRKRAQLNSDILQELGDEQAEDDLQEQQTVRGPGKSRVITLTSKMPEKEIENVDSNENSPSPFMSIDYDNKFKDL